MSRFQLGEMGVVHYWFLPLESVHHPIDFRIEPEPSMLNHLPSIDLVSSTAPWLLFSLFRLSAWQQGNRFTGISYGVST